MEEDEDDDDEDEEMELDLNGIRLIIEREYRILKFYDELDGLYVMKLEEEREYRKLEFVGLVGEDDDSF